MVIHSRQGIIVFSNSGRSAKLISTMRPSVKITTISPNVNVSRQTSLLWGVESINSRDPQGWKDMMNISKQIIKKDGIISLFGRGLKTKIISNGLQGALFSILWKLIQKKME